MAKGYACAGGFKIFWMEASAATRGFIYTVSTIVGIGALGGLYYLAIKEPDKAQATLVRLKGICGNCEEARDLEKAIKAYRR